MLNHSHRVLLLSGLLLDDFKESIWLIGGSSRVTFTVCRKKFKNLDKEKFREQDC